jgi:hypothetical protein
VKDDFRLRARDVDAHPLARLEGNSRGKRELFAGEEKKQAPRFSANRRGEGRPGSERETWRKVYILEHETAAGGGGGGSDPHVKTSYERIRLLAGELYMAHPQLDNLDQGDAYD